MNLLAKSIRYRVLGILSVSVLLLNILPFTASAATDPRCPSWVGSTVKWQTPKALHYNQSQLFCLQDSSGGKLVWLQNGDLEWSVNGKIKWTSNTVNRGVTLNFQGDSNIVVRSANGTALWAINLDTRNAEYPYWISQTATGNCYFYFDTQALTPPGDGYTHALSGTTFCGTTWKSGWFWVEG